MEGDPGNDPFFMYKILVNNDLRGIIELKNVWKNLSPNLYSSF
jgi:hypothetical protein